MRGTRTLAAIALLTSTAAFGADLPPVQSYRAPVAVAAPLFNWSGFYIGAMGGYAFGSGDTSSLSGGFAGGTIGVNYQPAGTPWVFGVEGDGAWSNFGRAESATVGGFTVTASSTANFIATLRGRGGVAWDTALLYVTGGGAWARNTIEVTAAGGGISVGLSDTQIHAGWTAGAGLEWAFNRNWSAKVEYLYIDLAGATYFQQYGGYPSNNAQIQTIKGGLNWRM